MTREVRLTLIGILLGLFLAALDQTIVATALPRIVEEFGKTHLYAWVATSYLLSSTVAVPIFGRLADLIAAKRVLLWAILIFLLGSALSGLSPSMEALIAFRGVQGIGGGALFAVAITTIGLLFPPRERGRVQGLFGAMFGIASVVGPWLGGLLTDHLSWRWVFYINMPVGAVALYFTTVHMPPLPPRSRHRFDYLGATSLILWTVPLLLATSWGGSTYPWTSPEILGLLALTALGLALFLWAERTNPEPLFDLTLLNHPVFRWASVALFFFGSAFLSAMLFLPLYLIQVKGISATSSGLTLTPLVLGVVVGSFTSGQLASRFGRYKPLMIAGNLWLIAGFLLMHQLIRVDTPLWQVLLMMVGLGLGLGPSMPLYTLAVQNAVDPARMGTASSATQFFRQIGSTIGAALMGTVLAASLQATMSQALPSLTVNGTTDPAALTQSFEARLKTLEAQLQAAADGDPAALEALRASPFLPPEAQAFLERLPEDPAQRAAALAGLRAELLARANATRRAVQEALDQAITDAVRQVYLYASGLVLLGFLATLRLPDATLKGRAASPGGTQ